MGGKILKVLNKISIWGWTTFMVILGHMWLVGLWYDILTHDVSFTTLGFGKLNDYNEYFHFATNTLGTSQTNENTVSIQQTVLGEKRRSPR